MRASWRYASFQVERPRDRLLEGIEPNEEAARLAKSRIDRVLCQTH